MLFSTVSTLVSIEVPEASASSIVVDNTAYPESVQYSSQRKTFYSQGRFWVFYFEQSELLSSIFYKSSTDGITWTASQLAIKDPSYSIVGFDVWNDDASTFIGIGYMTKPINRAKWRSGTLASDGSISWGSIVDIYLGTGSATYYGSTIAIDKSATGVWWAAFGVARYGFVSSNDYRIFNSIDAGASWTQIYVDTGITPDLDAIYLTNFVLATNDSQDVYFILMAYTHTGFYWYKWTGSMSAIQTHDLTNPMADNVWKPDDASAVIGEDNLMHFTWIDANDDLYYVDWDGTDWGTETLLKTGTCAYPSLSINPANGYMMIFYVESNVLRCSYHSLDWGPQLNPFGDTFSSPAYVTTSKHNDGVYYPTTWRETNTYDIMFGMDVELPPVCLNVAITDMEGCGNWVFSEKKYYTFEATFQLIPSWEAMTYLLINFSDGFWPITVAYNVTGAFFEVVEGSDQIILKAGTVSNSTADILTVQYLVYFRNTILDAYDVDIGANAYVLGTSSGWSIIEADYFNIYNFGGLVKYTLSGDGSKVPQGDVFELQVDPATGSALAEMYYRKLQHLRLLWKFSVPTNRIDSAYSDEKYASFGFDYCYVLANGSDYWVDGWNAKIGISNGYNSVKDFWVNIHVRWYRDDQLQGSSEYFYSFWNVEPDQGTTLWTDLWFNSANASSVAGGRVSCEYFGMQNAAPWWAFWFSDWGPLLSNQTSSTYYKDLLGINNEVITTQQIKFVRVWAYAEKPSSSDSYKFEMHQYNSFDKMFAPPDPSPFYGIDTPEWVPPKVFDMPQGGMFGWLFIGLKNLLKGLTPNLLAGWAVFAGALDMVFSFAGWKNGFSALVGWVTTLVTFTIDGMSWLALLLVAVFQLFTAGLTTIIDVFVIFVVQWVNAIGFISSLFSGAYGVGVNVVTEYNLVGFMQLFGVLYMVWLFYLLDSDGMEGVWHHFEVMGSILGFFINIFLGIAMLFLKVITSMIESVPVVE